MDVSFRSSKLRRECEDFRLSTRKWGPENAEAIVKRITDILAFQTLAMLIASKRGNCHPLTGDRKGKFALDLAQGWRLIFIPDYEEWNDTSLVTKVKIIEVVDYHD